MGTWPPPVSKLPILHDGVVIFVLVLSLGENCLCIGSLNEPSPWLTMEDLDKMLTRFRV